MSSGFWLNMTVTEIRTKHLHLIIQFRINKYRIPLEYQKENIKKTSFLVIASKTLEENLGKKNG